MRKSGIDRDNWPQFRQGRTIGMRGEVEIVPKKFEKLTTYKDLNNASSTHLPERVLNMRPGAGVRVMGRAPGKYAITASDHGDPVVLVNRALVEPLGFDPDKFNWEEVDKK